MTLLRSLFRRFVPASIKRRRREQRELGAFRDRAAANRARPRAEVFGDIYRTHAWGRSGDGGYFSGTGTVGQTAERYIAGVNRFVADHAISSIVDIGCGDFRIGGQLRCAKYTGVDLVPEVVEQNNAGYAGPSVDFILLDAVSAATLPAGELCLIRQVFQHLPNADILAILPKLKDFRFVLVTEHYPSDADFRRFNTDIAHGQDTRLAVGSGVYLDRAPFDRPVELLFESSEDDGAAGVYQRGPIRTYLLDPTARAS